MIFAVALTLRYAPIKLTKGQVRYPTQITMLPCVHAKDARKLAAMLNNVDVAEEYDDYTRTATPCVLINAIKGNAYISMDDMEDMAKAYLSEI